MNLQVPTHFLWFLPLGGIIVALYLLRMRRQDVRVPATFLWPEHTEEIRANSLFQKLRFNWLMVLQLLVAGFLCFAFSQPQVRQEGLLGETTVIVIDTSASMRATDVSPTRFDAALDLVRAAINTSKPTDRFALIEAGAIPRVAFSLSNDPAKQRDALNRIHATDEEGNMGEALRLASALVSSLDSARILVISDGCFPKVENFTPGKATVIYKSIGTRQENLAITALGSAKTGRGNEIYCGVRNFGLNKAETNVEIYADEKLISTTKVVMQSLKSAGVSCLAPASAHILHAKIDAKDLLSADNELYASADPNAAISTLLVSKGNPFLERALLLDPRITLDKTETLPNSERGTVSKFDLIIFDGVTPEPVSSRAVVSFGPSSEASGATSSPGQDSPKITDITENPLTKGVNFGTTYIEKGFRLKPYEGAKTLVESNQGPIVVADDGDTKKVAVSFNSLDSDFPLQVGFPIFIANIIDFVAKDASGGDIVTKPGSTFAFRSADDVSISGPNSYQQTVPAKDGQAIWRDIPYAGKYLASINGKKVNVFACLRSDIESNIATKPDLVLGGGKVKAIQTPFRLQDYWRMFVMFCLMLLALEWWVYSRKS
jgi:Ca-activated chloride channel family protein